MTDIADICARIVQIGTNISGIVSASDPPSLNLDTFEMPHLMVFAGPSTDDEGQGGDDFTVETRLYRVVVAAMPHGQGVTLEAEALGRSLIQAVKEYFRARKSLENLEGVQHTRVLGDSGIIRIGEYDGKYLGFEVRLEVSLYVAKTYVDY